MGEDTYTTGQAARILRVTDRGVRKMIERGELEATTDERGRHLIPQRVLHESLEERRESMPPPEDLAGDPHAAREAAELRARVEALQRELGRLEGRLELTEKTESTMAEERERLLSQLEEEKAERRRLAERLEELQRPWWRRMFGG